MFNPEKEKKKKKKPLQLEELENALPEVEIGFDGGAPEEANAADEEFNYEMEMDFSTAKKKKKKKKDLDELVAEEGAEKPDEKDNGKCFSHPFPELRILSMLFLMVHA